MRRSYESAFPPESFFDARANQLNSDRLIHNPYANPMHYSLTNPDGDFRSDFPVAEGLRQSYPSSHAIRPLMEPNRFSMRDSNRMAYPALLSPVAGTPNVLATYRANLLDRNSSHGIVGPPADKKVYAQPLPNARNVYRPILNAGRPLINIDIDYGRVGPSTEDHRDAQMATNPILERMSQLRSRPLVENETTGSLGASQQTVLLPSRQHPLLPSRHGTMPQAAMQMVNPQEFNRPNPQQMSISGQRGLLPSRPMNASVFPGQPLTSPSFQDSMMTSPSHGQHPMTSSRAEPFGRQPSDRPPALTTNPAALKSDLERIQSSLRTVGRSSGPGEPALINENEADYNYSENFAINREVESDTRTAMEKAKVDNELETIKMQVAELTARLAKASEMKARLGQDSDSSLHTPQSEPARKLQLSPQSFAPPVARVSSDAQHLSSQRSYSAAMDQSLFEGNNVSDMTPKLNNLEALENTHVDQLSRGDYDEAQNALNEQAQKLKSSFKEMLVKYNSVRQNKAASVSSSVQRVGLMDAASLRSRPALLNTVMDAAVHNSFPSIRAQNRPLLLDTNNQINYDAYQAQSAPSFLDRTEDDRRTEEEKKQDEQMEKFSCFVFDKVPVCNLDNLQFPRNSLQRTINEHLSKCLPRCPDFKIDDAKKCNQNHRKLFNQLKNLLIFDHLYETCVWDYDPRFSVDYLPDTKRGLNEAPYFVWNKTYAEEENKWRKYTHLLESINKRKVNETILAATANKSGSQTGLDASCVTIEKFDSDEIKTTKLALLMKSSFTFPEDSISEDYCGICQIAFSSILASISHYTTPLHNEQILEHCCRCAIDLLVTRNSIIEPNDSKKTWFTNTIKSIIKTYKTRPEHWMCDLCSIPLTSSQHALQHFAGTVHKKKASEGTTASNQIIAMELQMRANMPTDFVSSNKLKSAPAFNSRGNVAYFKATRSLGSSSGYVGNFRQ